MAADQGFTRADTPQTGRSSRIKGRLQQMLAFASLVLIFLFFSVVNSNFLTFSNVTGILLSTAVVGLLALGVTFVIITGGIDLSVGTGMTLVSVMAGVFLVNLGLPLVVGVTLAVLFGALIGFVNGVLVSVLKIPPFIATLATMMAAEGLALVISDARPIYFSDVEGYANISLGALIPRVPNAILVFFGMAVIAWLILSKTIIGRYTFAIGSNEEATALSGVNVIKWKILIYTVAGVFTGVAGVVISSRLSSAQPALGLGYELEAIAAVVIGGTSLSGGKGSIVGTVIGALIMGVLVNGLRIMSIPQEWQQVAVGVVILIAVYIDILRRRGA